MTIRPRALGWAIVGYGGLDFVNLFDPILFLFNFRLVWSTVLNGMFVVLFILGGIGMIFRRSWGRGVSISMSCILLAAIIAKVAILPSHTTMDALWSLLGFRLVILPAILIAATVVKFGPEMSEMDIRGRSIGAGGEGSVDRRRRYACFVLVGVIMLIFMVVGQTRHLGHQGGHAMSYLVVRPLLSVMIVLCVFGLFLTVVEGREWVSYLMSVLSIVLLGSVMSGGPVKGGLGWYLIGLAYVIGGLLVGIRWLWLIRKERVAAVE